MKKQTLNEQVSRIKEMMGIDELNLQLDTSQIKDDNDGDDVDPYAQPDIHAQGEELPTDDSSEFDDEELYDDGDDETIDDPSDDQIMNGYGREGGISYKNPPAWNGR
jgi:hypothetical protein